MADQNHVNPNATGGGGGTPAPLGSANSVNGNTAPVEAGGAGHPVGVTASASENELTTLAPGHFLTVKNSMELHKKKAKLDRHNKSLPSVFEPDDYCKAASVKRHEQEHEQEQTEAAMAAAMNSNHLPGEPSLLSLKKTRSGVKKKVEWADLRRTQAKHLVTDTSIEYDKMDTSGSVTSDSELETEWITIEPENYAGSDPETGPVVSLLRPPPSHIISEDSQTLLASDTEMGPDNTVNDLVHNIEKVGIIGSARPVPQSQLQRQLDVQSGFLGRYERPYPNPFANVPRSIDLAQSHMESNYTALQSSLPHLQDYYTPRNTVPDLVGGDRKLSGPDSKCPASPLIGQYCPFPRQTPGDDKGNGEIMEVAFDYNEDSAVDFGRPPPDDDNNGQIGDQNQTPLLKTPVPASAPPADDDDEELFEPEKKVEIRLPSIDELWVPTVVNVAAITPPEQHHLIEVNCKKDCRTWLWKSARQRAERYRRINGGPTGQPFP